jgi:predicted DNA-binding transcriptional regulator AlpA
VSRPLEDQEHGASPGVQVPKRVQVGENRVAWVLDEIENWIAARTSARATPAATPVVSP